jgi:hypothetical protein
MGPRGEPELRSQPPHLLQDFPDDRLASLAAAGVYSLGTLQAGSPAHGTLSSQLPEHLGIPDLGLTSTPVG